jgi:ornithine carbamoyltransferase
MVGCAKMGMHFVACAPEKYFPNAELIATCQAIAAETGATAFALDMAMAGDNYFDAMYHNIDTIREALG